MSIDQGRCEGPKFRRTVRPVDAATMPRRRALRSCESPQWFQAAQEHCSPDGFSICPFSGQWYLRGALTEQAIQNYHLSAAERGIVQIL